MSAAVASCENHPQREAIGVCVKCRTRVCSECATKVEGINYCVSCLAGLAVKGARNEARAARGRGASAYVVAGGCALLLVLGVWLLLEILLPGAA